MPPPFEKRELPEITPLVVGRRRTPFKMNKTKAPTKKKAKNAATNESGEKISRMKLEQLCQLALDSQAQLQQANLELTNRLKRQFDEISSLTNDIESQKKKVRTIENS